MNGSGAIELFQKMILDREAKRKAVRDQLAELEQEIQSILHTQKMFMQEHGISELTEAPLFEQGLSLTKRRERALVQWAEGNNGLLIPKEAKKALIAAKLVKPGKSAGWTVYGTIGNMDCWEKVDRGKYRLVPSTSPNGKGLRQTALNLIKSG